MDGIARAIGVAGTGDRVRLAREPAHGSVPAIAAALGLGAVVFAVAQRGHAGADIGSADAAIAVVGIDTALLIGPAAGRPATDRRRLDAATPSREAGLVVGATVGGVALECGAVELGLAASEHERDREQPHEAKLTRGPRRIVRGSS